MALTETASRPALILGTSSDRIGTPDGRAFYATISKDLTETTGLPIAPYVGVTYGTFDDRARVMGGANVYFNDWLTSTTIFDGVKVHQLFNVSAGRHQFGFLLVEGKKPGASYSVSF